MKLKQSIVLVLLWALLVLNFIDFDLNAGMNNPGGVGGEVFTNANNRFTTNSSQLYEFGPSNTFVWSNVINKASVRVHAGSPLDDRVGMIEFRGSNGVFGTYAGVIGGAGGFMVRRSESPDTIFIRIGGSLIEIGPDALTVPNAMDLGSGLDQIRFMGNSEVLSEMFLTTNYVTFGLNASFLETHNGRSQSYPNGGLFNSIG